MATEIGIVKALIGTAVVTAVDGSQRNLLVGDRVSADEIITTGDASAIEIEFSDGSIMDLGRNTQTLLDNEVFDPQQTIPSATDVDIAGLQDALVDGEDPTQQGEAPAAGPESEGNDGGLSTVIVEHNTSTVNITSGFEAGGVARNFLNEDSLFGDTVENTNDTLGSADSGSIVGSNSAPVIDAVASNLSGSTFNGLNAEYYGVDSQLRNIAQFRGIVNSNDPDAIFRATEISYSHGRGTVSQGENLQSFISGDAATLSADPDNNTDGGLHMFGQVYLEAGTYMFRVRGDDGYQITIDGDSVGEVDRNQPPTTRTHDSFTIASDGYHEVDIVWWDQGGNYVFEPALSKEGGTFETFSSANFEFKSEATSSVIEAGVTDSGAIVEGISSATGFMTAIDADAGAVLTWSVDDGVGAYGALSVDPVTGQWTYVLDNVAANPLAEGELVTEPFTIIVTDEHGATDNEVVTITIQGANDSSTIVGDSGSNTLIGGYGDDILTGAAGDDIFVWNAGDVGTAATPAHDEVTDFDANNDVLNLADLLSDGSHTIEGMETGAGDLQLNIKDGGGNVVQEIELHGVSVATTATQLLDDLLSSGAINDGI